MGIAKGGPGSSDATERLKRQMEGLRKEIRRLTSELTSAEETTARLSERLHAQSSEPRKDSRIQARMRTLSRQLKRQATIIKRDNTVARELQEGLRALWPAGFEGVQFAVETIPGERVRGDFYDAIKISDSCLGLLIADVSGYGLTAAVIMAQARMAFRTFATMESSPKAILERVNESLLQTTLAGHHLTAFMGLLDTEMLTFQYVNASHCPPYLIRSGELIPLDTEGLFVGMFDEPRYQQACIQLENQDKLFLFTDGLLRLFDGEAWDRALSKLEDYLRENSNLPIQELTRHLSKEIIRTLPDDVAILGIELLHSRVRHKEVTIYSIPTEVRRVEDTILPALSARGYGERSLFAVRLALEEAIINAIQHGNRLDNTKKVTVGFTLDDDKVVISVADEGEGFDLESVPDPTLDENLEIARGRGLVLMRAYMDSVKFNKQGNKVTMTKLAPWYTQRTKRQARKND